MDDAEREFIEYAKGNYSAKQPSINFMAQKAERTLHFVRIYDFFVDYSLLDNQRGVKLFETALTVSEQEFYEFFKKTLEEIAEE